MRTLKLKRNGEIVYLEMGNEIPVSDEVLPSMLSMNIDMEDAVTLRSFFRMLQRYTLLRKLDGWISHLLDVIGKMPELGCSDPRLAFVEVGQSIFITSKSKTPKMRFGKRDPDGFTETTFDYIDKPFRNLNQHYSLSGRREDSHERYSISLTPLNEILDLKLKVGKAIVYVMEDDRQLDESFDMTINLLSLISCIVMELTFHGTEEQKKEQLDQLKELVEDTDNKLKRRERREKLSVIEGGLNSKGEK